MKFRLFVAFIGGILLASAAFLVASRSPEPAVVQPESIETPAVIAPPAEVTAPVVAPEPAPKPVPQSKRQATSAPKRARAFLPEVPAATTAFEPAVIATLPPDVSPEVVAPESLGSGLFEEQLPAVPPREPRVITIPEKTPITIRLGERLASDRSEVGDAFFGSLDAPLVVDGWVVAERGSRVIGRVTDVESGGRVKGTATITLELSSLTASDGQRVSVRTANFLYKGDTSKKGDAVKVGIGTVIGAAIGAAAGGGKGAAIGAASGAAAGAGAVALTRGKAAVLEAETRLTFQLARAVTVTAR